MIGAKSPLLCNLTHPNSAFIRIKSRNRLSIRRMQMNTDVNSISKSADVCSAEIAQIPVPIGQLLNSMFFILSRVSIPASFPPFFLANSVFSEFSGRPYVELFNHFVLEKDYVPLGFYRSRDAKSVISFSTHPPHLPPPPVFPNPHFVFSSQRNL